MESENRVTYPIHFPPKALGTNPYSRSYEGEHPSYNVRMACGGINEGFSYGSTEDFGLAAMENRVQVHGLNATILQRMGLAHERLTYRF